MACQYLHDSRGVRVKAASILQLLFLYCSPIAAEPYSSMVIGCVGRVAEVFFEVRAEEKCNYGRYRVLLKISKGLLLSRLMKYIFARVRLTGVVYARSERIRCVLRFKSSVIFGK